jgi:hypothetical protein
MTDTVLKQIAQIQKLSVEPARKVESLVWNGRPCVQPDRSW